MRAFTCLVLALPAFVACNARASARGGPYSIELIADDGQVLPTFWKDGRTYVLGAKGERYSVRIRNQSATRVEFVASVDGRDVLDGNPASWAKRGYIVNPWDEVVIDGFRLDENRVAAFRFSAVRDSYAARMGDARDVGVIGVAVFRESSRPPMADQRMIPNSGLLDMKAAEPVAPAPPPIADGMRAEAQANSAARKKDRPGLGTEFGESRWSHVNEVDFARASVQPSVILSLRYDDRAGLRAMGVNLRSDMQASEVDLRETAQPFRRNYCAPPPGWGQ